MSVTAGTGERQPGKITPADQLPVLSLEQARTLAGRFHDVMDDEVPNGATMDGWNLRTLAHTIEVDLRTLADVEQAFLAIWPHLNYGTRKSLIEARNKLRERIGLEPTGFSA